MATPTQKAKGVRWLYIIIALVVVLGLAYWLTSYNLPPTGDAAAPTAPAATTTN